MKSKGDGRAHPGSVLLEAVTWLSVVILLAGCGGSGSGSGSHPSGSLTYPSSALVFVVGTAITPAVPTASQGLSSFTVTPALPSGLSLNSGNGTISGTPTAVSAVATYTVMATGGGASASASLSISVNSHTHRGIGSDRLHGHGPVFRWTVDGDFDDRG